MPPHATIFFRPHFTFSLTPWDLISGFRRGRGDLETAKRQIQTTARDLERERKIQLPEATPPPPPKQTHSSAGLRRSRIFFLETWRGKGPGSARARFRASKFQQREIESQQIFFRERNSFPQPVVKPNQILTFFKPKHCRALFPTNSRYDSQGGGRSEARRVL